MQHVLSDRIITLDDVPRDGKFRFSIPDMFPSNGTISLSDRLAPFRDTTLDWNARPKLWSDSFPKDRELALFSELVEGAIRKKKKIHIEGLTLAEEVAILRKLYTDLGYYDPTENRFEIDFGNCPVTAGVNIRNIVYSSKDARRLGKDFLVSPPIRESHDDRALRAGINSGVIATLSLNDPKQEKPLLEMMLREGNVSPITLGRTLFFNYCARGIAVSEKLLVFF